MKQWLFKRGNEYLRSVICLLNAVIVGLGICMIDSYVVDTYIDMLIIAVSIFVIIVNTASFFGLLDYIYTHDRIERKT